VLSHRVSTVLWHKHIGIRVEVVTLNSLEPGERRYEAVWFITALADQDVGRSMNDHQGESCFDTANNVLRRENS
jgi:hypothetical protein